MRRSSGFLTLLGAMGVAALLSACSDGSPSASASAGGASGSGSASASGTVTGFGSLFVNGKKFEANDVLAEQDGESKRCNIGPNDTCGFKKGMQVIANGSFSGSQHTASSVRQKDAVEGLVQSVAADRFVVMGQTVLFDETTIFDNNFTPTVGSFVEVNGHIQPNGVIQATFIEPKAPAVVTPEVRGFVNNHDVGSSTFRIGTLIVNYIGAITNDMPPGNWDGLFVEVKGANAAAFNSATTTLTASKVEPENRGIGNNVDKFEVEGFVTAVRAPGDFDIGTTRVQTTANTEFRGGLLEEIVVGAKLSAEGRFDGTTLIAKHVKFHANVKLEGNIASINGNTFTIVGLPGIQVSVNSQTEGGQNLQINSHVRVRGRVSGTSSVIATRLEQRSGNTDVDLQGPVQSVAGQSLTILGVPVDTTPISNNNFEGIDDQVIGRAAFFAAVQEGTLVKVKGQLNNGTTVNWNEAELED